MELELSMDCDKHVENEVVRLRSLLLHIIMSKGGISAWTTYWNNLNAFVMGRISKSEFDVVVCRSLDSNEST